MCTYTCKRAEACLVACGFYSDSWQSCNASSNEVTTEVACKIERGESILDTSIPPTENDASAVGRLSILAIGVDRRCIIENIMGGKWISEKR